MTYDYGQTTPTTRRLLHIACLAALAAAFMVLRVPLVYATDLELPSVPENLEVPAGNKVFLKGHAIGTQNYICLPSDSGFSWIFFGPQATLFIDHDEQIITHFLSLNSDESDIPRATWQHSRDTSTIWAKAKADFVVSGAISWLLLEFVGADPGPTGGKRLTRTTFIQRLNTTGWVAPEPSAGCALSTDIGNKALVAYTADYIFYKAVTRK